MKVRPLTTCLLAPLFALAFGFIAPTQCPGEEAIDEARLSALVELIKPGASESTLESIYKEISRAGDMGRACIPELVTILKKGGLTWRDIYLDQNRPVPQAGCLLSLHYTLRLLMTLKANDPELATAVSNLLTEALTVPKPVKPEELAEIYASYNPGRKGDAGSLRVDRQPLSRQERFCRDLVIATSSFNDGKGTAVPVLLRIARSQHVKPTARTGTASGVDPNPSFFGRDRVVLTPLPPPDGVIYPIDPMVFYGHLITEALRVLAIEMLAEQGVNTREIRVVLHRLTLEESSHKVVAAANNSLRRISQLPQTEARSQTPGVLEEEPPVASPRPVNTTPSPTSTVNSANAIRAQIEGIDASIRKLEELAADVNGDIAEARSGNRRSSVAMLSSTLSDCRQQIADLKRERSKLQEALNEEP